MLIGSNDVNFGLSTRLIEPELNRDASNYVTDNYANLLVYVHKLGIKDEKANDLLHDVYISLVEAENNNECFDMEYSGRNSEKYGEYMHVSQFVYGRIGQYAKNVKYRTDVTESGVGTSVGIEVYYVDEIGLDGKVVLNKDGTPRKIKKTKTKRQAVSVITCAASFTGGDGTQENDSFQMAYEMAETVDSTDDVAELLSLREEIDYCIDLCSLHNIPILSILKNIDSLADMLCKSSKRAKSYDRVFRGLHDIAEYHSEFANCLTSILEYSSKNRYAFDALIQSY